MNSTYPDYSFAPIAERVLRNLDVKVPTVKLRKRELHRTDTLSVRELLKTVDKFSIDSEDIYIETVGGDEFYPFDAPQVRIFTWQEVPLTDEEIEKAERFKFRATVMCKLYEEAVKEGFERTPLPREAEKELGNRRPFDLWESGEYRRLARYYSWAFKKKEV